MNSIPRPRLTADFVGGSVQTLALHTAVVVVVVVVAENGVVETGGDL
jgi:hypothetical protein